MPSFDSCFHMLMPNYSRVFVLANGKQASSLLGFLGLGDLLVIFNEGNIPENLNSDVDVLWIHRENESTRMYFGFNGGAHGSRQKVFHVFVKEQPNNESDFLSGDYFLFYGYKNSLLHNYPIGKKIFGFSNKDKKIISPSTGFIFLTFLESIVSDFENIRVFPIGFGRFPNGWYGHAWSYERKKMSMMPFMFLTRDLKKDRWLPVRAIVPDFFIRIFMDISKINFKVCKNMSVKK